MSQLCTRTCARTYVHTQTPTLSILHGMRTSALNFVFGTRLRFSHAGQPHLPFPDPLFTHHFRTGLFPPSNQIIKKKKKKALEGYPLYFLSGNKNKFNGKTQVFFFFFFFNYFFFFSDSRHNVYQYPKLSIFTPRFQVQCVDTASQTIGLSAHTLNNITRSP